MKMLTPLLVLLSIAFIGAIVYIIFFAGAFYVVKKVKEKRKSKKDHVD